MTQKWLFFDIDALIKRHTMMKKLRISVVCHDVVSIESIKNKICVVWYDTLTNFPRGE
jgi:hypothetical protein